MKSKLSRKNKLNQLQKSQTIIFLLRRLWGYLNPAHKIHFFLLIALSLLGSLADILSIGAVMPFLGVITNSINLFEYPLARPFLTFFQLDSTRDLTIAVAILFIGVVILSGLIRFLLNWGIAWSTTLRTMDLSCAIYQRILYQTYTLHMSRTSSQTINAITGNTGVVSGVISSSLSLITALIMLSFILASLFYIDPLIAISAIVGFGSIYLLVIRLTKSKLMENGRKISNDSTRVISTLQESVGGIRDVILGNTQEVFYDSFKKTEMSLRDAMLSNQMMHSAPRFVIETFGLVLIALLALLLMLQSNGSSDSIVVLGAMAMGALRLLPVLQTIYESWSVFKGGQAPLEDVLNLLDQPVPVLRGESQLTKIEFNSHIELSNVSFRYQKKAPLILSDVNLIIQKGERVGFIGRTGSGKSTLLDIVMALLLPSGGKLLIDGKEINELNQREWQMNIAHVPQSIFISEGTIAENVAFGFDKKSIQFDRIVEALKMSQLYDFVKSLDKGINSHIGERGVRLSGGQRQRLGIARALYKRAEVIVFDEATSALDSETEQAVMESIDALDKSLTILIIAHRVSTLRNCNYIVRLTNGHIGENKKYSELKT